MPANLTPQYEKAEQRYREARTPEEKLEALEEMLRVMPKHKGTDHLQADVKRRISKLRKGEGKRAAGKRIDLWHVPRSGGGQVGVLGCPNVGKSALVGSVTSANVTVAEFPFSTRAPVPGIMYHEDLPIQLVDLPPVTAEHVPPGMWGLLRNVDALLLVVDLADAEVLDQVDTLLCLLASRRLEPLSQAKPEVSDDPEASDPVRALLIGNKIDLVDPGDLEVLGEMYGPRLRVLGTSARTGEGLEVMRREVRELLNVLRVYCKEPGKDPDRDKPFVLPIGSTVADLAEKIHREFPKRLKFARLWGDEKFQGIQVHGDFVLSDRDVVELHLR